MYALIHGINLTTNNIEPLFAQGVNTENSFYTDGPSITAAQGFVNMISSLKGLQVERKGRFTTGISIKSFSLIIHDYHRNAGKVAFKSGTCNYINPDNLVNAPVPVELLTANMAFTIVIEYEGKLLSEEDIDNTLNHSTRRFNGGEIMNDIMITPIDSEGLIHYLKQNKGNQIVDRSDLSITTWDQLFEYTGFFENPETKRRDLRKHAGTYYAHQTGYLLLETPQERNGTLLYGDQKCKHAYCEPIINLAQLKHTTHISNMSDLCFWAWHEDKQLNTITLQSNLSAVDA